MENLKKKSSILVVDDTPDILSLIMELLKDKYNLKLANSPKKALNLLKSKPDIDLILLDIMMPEIDGYEMCKIIKSDQAYSQTPIIFLTALEKVSDIVKGFECGAVDYITKPFIPEVLKARVKTHVELKKLHDSMLKDLKAKEEMLFKKSKMAILGEMFENVTHQWKQPLSTINMSCSALQMDIEFDEIDSDEFSNTIDTISTEATYLSQTIDDFRDFARDDIEKESFDLKNAFAQSTKILSQKLEKTSVEIINEIENIKYRSYKNLLTQVLISIVNNSIDALIQTQKKQRWIKAKSFISENEVIITICDNANGIKIDNLDSIFNKYITTKDDEESGIGLYMCQQIIQNKYDGKISAYNTQEGACFELCLPIVNEDSII
nr:hybrid sensor histidine kinase/response regulator [uncultured Sulfurimonas sp.]